MFARRCCVVALFGLVALSRTVSAQQQDICRVGIPANVDAGLLASDFVALLRRSDTFRAQCERIAADPRIRVKLDIVNTLDSGRAQTAIHRFDSGALRADVQVLFGENYRELLAHEFEHIIEQADGVNLRQEAARGQAWLLPSGAYETRRAAAAGVQVLRECELLRAHAAAAVQPTR
jgi:hypothetical protein